MTKVTEVVDTGSPLALQLTDGLGPNVRNLRALAALRRGAPLHDASETEAVWCDNAAAEIERLQAELDRRLHTVARMTLTLPDGRVFPIEHDFGYAYPPESAEYMFTGGNYGCDCNRSLLLTDAGYEVTEMECGDAIKMADFRVSTEAPVA